MSVLRRFYQAYAIGVGTSPSTGYLFSSGNSGVNNILYIDRAQSVNDSFTVNRENVGQLGQLAILSKVITSPPSVNLDFSYYTADVRNELILGLYVSGDQGALTNILNQTQADKNYFIALAPEGVDAIGYTGQMQVKYVTNGFLTSYSHEAAVGGFPTTSVGVQGFNWATATGSINQPLYAIDFANNNYTTGVRFSLPTPTSGLANAVPAIRPSEITVSIANSIGYSLSDIHPQRYTVSFNLNNQRLTQLGQFFPYGIVPQFPVDVTMSVTANWGNIVTGSLGNLLCNDADFTVEASLNQPTCLGAPSGAVAAKYKLFGAKLDSESATLAYNDVTSPVTLNFTTTLGGPNDTAHNLTISGISY